jgi:hypothetical protein
VGRLGGNQDLRSKSRSGGAVAAASLPKPVERAGIEFVGADGPGWCGGETVRVMLPVGETECGAVQNIRNL